MVRPAVSKLAVATYRACRARRRRGRRRGFPPGADMVSIHTTSAPPSFRPSICSANTSTASSSVSGPSGASRSPVGPTEPPTTTRRPALSATSRAILRREPVQLAHAGLQLVQHQPAAVAAERVGEDDVGAGVDEALMQRADSFRMGAFHSSGVSPEASPASNRLVPVAPSASSGRPSARRFEAWKSCGNRGEISAPATAQPSGGRRLGRPKAIGALHKLGAELRRRFRVIASAASAMPMPYVLIDLPAATSATTTACSSDDVPLHRWSRRRYSRAFRCGRYWHYGRLYG